MSIYLEIKNWLMNNTSNTKGIYSETEFRAIFKHERARTDRDGNEFSLVIFKVDRKLRKEEKKIRKFIRLIKNRLRKTDSIGWFDSTHIAALLTSTSFEGAKTFTDLFEKRMIENKFYFSFMIYSYPSKKKWRHAKLTGKDIVPSEEALPDTFTHPIPFWKRLLDVSGSTFFLLIFFPIGFLLGIFIKIVSPGPVFFKQQRVGYKGKFFTIYKFRTMYMNNENQHKDYAKNFIKGDQKLVKMDKTDKRIIPGGKFIRKACIDELPQLFNIFLGDMSLVGPRPCIPYEESQFSQWHRQRFNTLPGLTGLWQVSGKEKLSFQQMIRLDIQYTLNKSLLLDLQILLRTIPTVLQFIFKSVTEKFIKIDANAA